MRFLTWVYIAAPILAVVAGVGISGYIAITALKDRDEHGDE